MVQEKIGTEKPLMKHGDEGFISADGATGKHLYVHRAFCSGLPFHFSVPFHAINHPPHGCTLSRPSPAYPDLTRIQEVFVDPED